MDEEIYQEQILEHSGNPRNMYAMENCTCVGDGVNPSCGDSGKLFANIVEDRVVEVSFTGTGCAISQAGMSMMTEYIKDKNIHDLKMIMPGDVYKMLGIKISPARALCALLCYNALEELIKNYIKDDVRN